MIPLIIQDQFYTPFRIFRGPLFHKPVTGQELFFAAYKIKGQARREKILMFVIGGFAELIFEALQNWYLLSTLNNEIQTVYYAENSNTTS